MTLSLVGISHRHTPVELRERVALDARQSAALAGEIAEGGAECVCLSTCNRTELYTVGDEAEARALEALHTLGGEEITALSYRLSDQAAALHLFRVAAGPRLARPRRGRDPRAGARGVRGRAPGPLLNRLFHDALHAGKKARAQTTIAESPASGLPLEPRSRSRCSAT